MTDERQPWDVPTPWWAHEAVIFDVRAKRAAHESLRAATHAELERLTDLFLRLRAVSDRQARAHRERTA